MASPDREDDNAPLPSGEIASRKPPAFLSGLFVVPQGGNAAG